LGNKSGSAQDEDMSSNLAFVANSDKNLIEPELNHIKNISRDEEE
tara:strand:+ start:252 stop:386 length:135 start_codon:yes stop_codon:yes gene_type:complete